MITQIRKDRGRRSETFNRRDEVVEPRLTSTSILRPGINPDMINLPSNCIDESAVRSSFVSLGTTVHDVMACINANSQRIALVVDEENRLISTLTDGDIRRAILDGVTTDSRVEEVQAHKSASGAAKPVTAPIDSDPQRLFEIMSERSIRQIPLTDRDGRVVGLVSLEDLIPQDIQSVRAVIMAGGFGKRLMPLTANTPKPMLPVGDRPLMEHTIEQLNYAGIRDVKISTHYMAEQIVQHFQDGSDFGVNVSYVNEDTPMGTAGALSLMEATDVPMLVMNGDILSGVDYRSIVSFHSEHNANMTICVRKYEMEVPYGVVECTGANVERIAEKPRLTFFVNAGIYLLGPEVHALIPKGERSDMPDLVQSAIAKGYKVVSFPIVEHWLDIGQHADYQAAQEVVKQKGSDS